MAVVHLSPELPVRGHKREPSEPGPTDFLSAGVIEGDEAPGLLQRSYSGRHRSGSSPQTLGVTNGKLRKSLRGLGRSSKAKQSAGEGNRGTSSSDAENATVQQIDSAFTKIREQLAKLSEEDQVLKERVDKLNEEISVLTVPRRHARSGSNHRVTSQPWKSACFSSSICEADYPSRMTRSPHSVPILLVSSSSQDNIRGFLQESGIVHDTIDEQTAVHSTELDIKPCHAVRGSVEGDDDSAVNIEKTVKEDSSNRSNTPIAA